MRPPLVAMLPLALAALTALPAPASEEGVSKMLLQCFHPTGRFTGSHTWGRWSGDVNYLADGSETYDITFRDGKTGAESRLEVAFMTRRRKDGKYEATAAVLNDTSPDPPREDCYLRKWLYVPQ